MKKLSLFFLSFLGINSAQAVWDPDALSTFNLPGTPVYYIIGNILLWLLGLLGLISIIAFMISGILYLTAAGNETQAEKAKRAMLYSIIGVIAGLSGFVVLQAATYMLSGASFF